MTASSPVPCPRCGTTVSGNFCAACGAPLGGATCLGCGTALAAGATFCHKCGIATSGATPGREAARGRANDKMPPARPPGAPPRQASHTTDRTPWLIAGVLVVLIIAGVFYSANRQSTPEVAKMANAGNAGNSVTGIADDPGAGCAPTGRAPDISSLTPKERFVRLQARINTALEKGDTACVISFTPLALGAYANLPATDRDIDARYHVAMLEAQVGMFDNARALADTIMIEAPDNLFGYYIRAATAEFAGDSLKAKAAWAEFRAHYDAEMKKNRPEYAEHRPFLEQYRTGDGAK